MSTCENSFTLPVIKIIQYMIAVCSLILVTCSQQLLVVIDAKNVFFAAHGVLCDWPRRSMRLARWVDRKHDECSVGFHVPSPVRNSVPSSCVTFLDVSGAGRASPSLP